MPEDPRFAVFFGGGWVIAVECRLFGFCEGPAGRSGLSLRLKPYDPAEVRHVQASLIRHPDWPCVPGLPD